MTRSHPWFAGFFAFGTIMCGLTLFLLCVPGTPLDSLWRINPGAQIAFESLGNGAVLLMAIVGTSCALAAIGLWRGTIWGKRLALAILTVNLAGDMFNAFFRHDYRTLIGLPIGGAMIIYLARR